MPIDTKKLSRSLMLGRGAILTPHIDAYLERGKFPPEWNITIHNDKASRDYGDAKIRFSAGSDALPAASELYKKVTGRLIPEKIGAQTRRTFDCGTMWHEYLGNILVDMGFIDQDGVEKYHIQKIETDKGTAYGSGLGDLVGVKIPGHGEWLVDMKTMKKSDFESEPAKYLWDKYVAQINIYGDWFGYDKLMILGIEKDSPHRLREWVIQPDKALVQHVYDKWIYVMSCVEQGVEPTT
jgi:hypothetical protein